MSEDVSRLGSKRPGVYVIGLTGGIATGKSTVSAILACLGAIIIDADIISREVVEPGSSGLKKVVQEFGPHMITKKGCLDRKKLSGIVFGDPKARKRLETILHPLIMEKAEEALGELSRGWEKDGQVRIAIFDAPLLFEAGADRVVDQVWVVWVDRSTQEQRLMARGGYTRGEVETRIDAQMPLEEKVRRAAQIIDNTGDVKKTEAQVEALWCLLKKDLASKTRNI